MTTLVVADQHFGAGASLGDRLADQRASWLAFCEKAVELNATVLHAGDVFHARKPTLTEMRAYQDGLDVLREGAIEMIIAAGNHDVQSADAPTAVEVASAGYQVHVCREPQAIETADGVVGFLPWMPPRMSAKQTADALMIVAEGLAEQGARLLVAHWAIAGWSLPNGLPLLELSEPLLDPHALAQIGAITLAGHIHKRQEIAPNVWHTGPLTRANFGEAEVETGYWRFDPNGYGAVDMPDRPFISIVADVRGSDHPGDAVLEAIEDWPIRDAIVRVAWQQTADQVVEQGEILAVLQATGAHYVDALTPIIERPQSTRSEGVTEHLDPREAWDVWASAQDTLASDDVMAAVREEAHSRIGGTA